MLRAADVLLPTFRQEVSVVFRNRFSSIAWSFGPYLCERKPGRSSKFDGSLHTDQRYRAACEDVDCLRSDSRDWD